MLLLNKKEVVVIVSPFTSHICKINTLCQGGLNVLRKTDRTLAPNTNGRLHTRLVEQFCHRLCCSRNDDSVKFQAYVCVDWKWKCTDV